MKVIIHKHREPILSASILRGNVLARDAFWAYHPVVVQKGKQYFIFYTGKGIKPGIAHATLLATSADLFHWQKRGVVLADGGVGEWDSDFTAHVFVFADKGKYFMLYDGSRRGEWLEEIGLAESRDLIHWKKYPANPVFRVGREWWEHRHVSRCSLFKQGGRYYLYYAGHDGQRERIGVAVGSSLVSSIKRLKGPVLDVGQKGEWDEKSISDPRLIRYKDIYLMFYSGIDAKRVERTGLALSSDLIQWRKYNGNPILDVTPGSWDGISASRAFPLVVNGTIYLFYSGRKNFFYSIGLAEVVIV